MERQKHKLCYCYLRRQDLLEARKQLHEVQSGCDSANMKVQELKVESLGHQSTAANVKKHLQDAQDKIANMKQQVRSPHYAKVPQTYGGT
jgi:hypothetical protein